MSKITTAMSVVKMAPPTNHHEPCTRSLVKATGSHLKAPLRAMVCAFLLL